MWQGLRKLICIQSWQEWEGSTTPGLRGEKKHGGFTVCPQILCYSFLEEVELNPLAWLWLDLTAPFERTAYSRNTWLLRLKGPWLPACSLFWITCSGESSRHFLGHSSTLKEKPTEWSPEASCQLLRKISQTPPLGPGEHSDDCRLSRCLDGNFVTDPGPEPPSWATPRFLILRNCEIINIHWYTRGQFGILQ